VKAMQLMVDVLEEHTKDFWCYYTNP
jgi:hypothetical protein